MIKMCYIRFVHALPKHLFWDVDRIFRFFYTAACLKLTHSTSAYTIYALPLDLQISILALYDYVTIRGSGQSLGVNTHLSCALSHAATVENTCFTMRLQKKEERRQPTVNHYNVTRGGVLQQRGWVGKQLSSRRTPVLTFSVDLDTENTWQCHSLYFKSTGCLTKPLHFPSFSSPMIPKTTFHTHFWNHDYRCKEGQTGRK